MAFKRRSYGRRKRFGRRRSTRRPFASRVKRVVRSFAEHKRTLMTWSAQEFDYNGHRKYLDEIAQGVNEGDRVGRIITPQTFVARLTITNVETVVAPIAWTALLVQDNQTVGDSHASVSEILSDIGTSAAPMGLINISNKGRFRIHRRWHGVLANQNVGPSAKYLSLYHKFRKPKNIRYNGTASTDIEANSLMFILISSAPPGDDSCYCTGTGRLWYTDV